MCQKTNFTFHFSERGRETLGTVPVKETWFLVLARGISSGDLHTGFSLLKILHRIAQPISPIGTIGLLGNWAWVTVLTARPMTQCQAKAKGRLAMGLLEKIWIARKHTNRWKHTIFYSICVASQLQFNSGASCQRPVRCRGSPSMIAINVRHWEHGNHGFARWRPVAPQPFAKPSVGGVATFGEAVMISVPIDLIHIYIYNIWYYT